ncbi:MAG: hypothetical protein BGO31_00585 [Bacteroidetes bacterium 43-16]|nr:MAG: hypothetical protein BGO31_00585 [Bacteroidetes bacterium 43-16]
MIPEFICHVIHIAATCTSFGGLFYSRVVLLPNLRYLPEPARTDYLNRMIKRFGYVKWIGVTAIVVTGIVQWLYIYPTVKDTDSYLIAFLVKMIGAVGLLSITLMLAVPNPRFLGMQKQRAFWSGLNLVCALLILVGAAWMREIRMS